MNYQETMLINYRTVMLGEEPFIECEVEMFGLTAKGTSRRQHDALSYALEALAKIVRFTKKA